MAPSPSGPPDTSVLARPQDLVAPAEEHAGGRRAMTRLGFSPLDLGCRRVDLRTRCLLVAAVSPDAERCARAMDEGGDAVHVGDVDDTDDATGHVGRLASMWPGGVIAGVQTRSALEKVAAAGVTCVEAVRPLPAGADVTWWLPGEALPGALACGVPAGKLIVERGTAAASSRSTPAVPPIVAISPSAPTLAGRIAEITRGVWCGARIVRVSGADVRPVWRALRTLDALLATAGDDR